MVPRFSDIEVIALSLTAETLSIDSENYLFRKLAESKKEIPNLISRRQFNDRRKSTSELCEKIRKRIADSIDGGENISASIQSPLKCAACQEVSAAKWGERIIRKLLILDIVPPSENIIMDTNCMLFAV